MAVKQDGKIVVGDTAGYITWFERDGEVLKTEKGASSVVSMKIDDTSNFLLVAR